MSTTQTSKSSISGPGLDGRQVGIDPHAVTISGIVLDPSYGPESPSESLQHLGRDIAAWRSRFAVKGHGKAPSMRGPRVTVRG